jgi:phage repressor protein C with HTH and peptisase S24 domain
MFSEEKTKELMAYFNVRSVKQLEIRLGLSNGYISNLQRKGTENPGRMLVALNENGISTDWFFSATNHMVLDELKKQPLGGIPSSTKGLKKQPFPLLSSGTNEDILEAVSGEGEPPDNTAISAEKRDVSVVSERTEAVSEAVKRRFPVVVEGDEKGVLVPVIGQGLSAGFGFDYDEGEVVRYIKIPAWIARKGRDLAALPVYGDSMEPTIGRGDLAVCVSGVFKDDGIYVLRDDDRGLMFCKRVKWAPGGWTIMSDNPRYEPMKVDDRAIQIVARVIAAVKEVK